MYSRGRKHDLRKTSYLPNQTRVVSEERNENKTKNAQGVVIMARASRICKFVDNRMLRVLWRGPAGTFYDFSQQVSSFVRSTAVGSATFCRGLPLQLLNPYHTISAVNALQAAAQVVVSCPSSYVLRDEHLSTDRPVCPLFSPGLLAAAAAAASFVCYYAASLLAATS